MSTSTRVGLAAIAPVALAAALSVPAPGAATSQGVTATNGRIAFSTGALLPHPQRDAHSQVYTVNPDGSDLQKLTHVPQGHQAGDPDWSPDGTQIAYTSGADGHFAIWVMNMDGTGKHLITGAPGWEYFTPRWSPDGSQLAFVACNDTIGVELYCDLKLMDADGGHQRVLVGGHRFNGDPDWSPDGSSIAFDSDRAGLVSAVWVVNTTGSAHPRRLTPAAEEAFWPQWAPSGDRILFTSTCCTDFTQLFTMKSDGSDIKQLTALHHHEFAGLGSYSPDGTRIVFISNHERPNGAAALFTMNGHGTELRLAVTGYPQIFASDWGASSSFDEPTATR